MSRALIVVLLVALSGRLSLAAETQPARLEPLNRVIDLKVGESSEVELQDGSRATVKLLSVDETRDTVCFAVRRAEVVVEVNGERVALESGMYQLPRTVGRVQIDCPVTGGFNKNGTPSFWGLDADARLRLWPAGSPWVRPDAFGYPVKQRWFACDTQMANEPVFVDAVKLAPEGFAATTHSFGRPGDYLVRVEHVNPFGYKAVAHLHVPVVDSLPQAKCDTTISVDAHPRT